MPLMMPVTRRRAAGVPPRARRVPWPHSGHAGRAHSASATAPDHDHQCIHHATVMRQCQTAASESRYAGPNDSQAECPAGPAAAALFKPELTRLR